MQPARSLEVNLIFSFMFLVQVSTSQEGRPDNGESRAYPDEFPPFDFARTEVKI